MPVLLLSIVAPWNARGTTGVNLVEEAGGTGLIPVSSHQKKQRIECSSLLLASRTYEVRYDLGAL